jgi:hypothetical protein
MEDIKRRLAVKRIRNLNVETLKAYNGAEADEPEPS